MKFIVIAYVIVQVAVVATVYAQDGEPNWTNRYLEVKQQVLKTFNGPPIGKDLTIVRRVGGEYTGRLDSIASNSVIISGTRYEMRQMTDNTCEMLFSDVYASRRARELVLRERDSYRSIQAEKQKKLQIVADLALQRAQAIKTEDNIDTHSKEERQLMAPESITSPVSQPAKASHDTSVFWILGIVIVVVLILFVSRRPSRCDACGIPIKRRFHTWKVDGVRKHLCPRCNQGFERHKSKQGLDNLLKRKR